MCREYSTAICRPDAIYMSRIVDIVPRFAGSPAIDTACRRYSTAICRFPCHLHVTCRKYSTSICRKFSLFPHSRALTLTNYLNISTIMPTNWSVLFHKTLAKYLWQYIEAHGDPTARAQVLNDCQKAIRTSPLHDELNIDLPDRLHWVSISFH